MSRHRQLLDKNDHESTEKLGSFGPGRNTRFISRFDEAGIELEQQLLGLAGNKIG